ncbi:hypothetical protein D3Y59_06445 [Hymenobacter oligotrophus]|uniref:Uncharacterized protein n=1 Tax=Hymenobacter oligotrophus TaxID=2319843 RepID=A0A3B7RB29_9BACT|nr:hypothetical protein [Hymenobacter oligotrophus]AYA36726.1 hypothetical protein D3Y59_06445 [Hymenobacter oligotrophus]
MLEFISQDLYYDLNLQTLTPEPLCVGWRVVSRRDGRRPEPGWAEAEQVLLSAEALHLATQSGGTQLAGTWSLERSSFLSQPYLVMQLAHGTSQALITRMRRSHDGARRLLTLYFQSGLEIELTHP